MKGVRNPEEAKKSVEKVINESLTKGRLFYERCDTGDMESVRSFAKKVQEKFAAIHVLINNGKFMSICDETETFVKSHHLSLCSRSDGDAI